MPILPSGTIEDIYFSATQIGSRTIPVNWGTPANGLMIVRVSMYDGAPGRIPNISSVTLGGSALLHGPDAMYQTGNLDYIADVWYATATNLPSGSANLVITWDATHATQVQTVIDWYTGAHQVQAEVMVASGTALGVTDPTGTIVPLVDGCLIAHQYTSESNDVLALASAGTIVQDHDWGAQVAGGAYYLQDTAGTYIPSWTGPDSNFALAYAAFKPYTAAGGTTYNQTALGTLSPDGTLARQTQTLQGGAVAPAGGLANQGHKTLSGDVTPGGVVALRTGKALSGEASPAGGLLRQVGKVVSGALTTAGELANRAGKPLGGALVSAGTIAKVPAKTTEGAIAPTGIVATVRAAMISLAGSLAPAGELVRRIGKQVSGTLAPGGGLVKRIARILYGVLTSAGALIAAATTHPATGPGARGRHYANLRGMHEPHARGNHAPDVRGSHQPEARETHESDERDVYGY